MTGGRQRAILLVNFAPTLRARRVVRHAFSCAPTPARPTTRLGRGCSTLIGGCFGLEAEIRQTELAGQMQRFNSVANGRG